VEIFKSVSIDRIMCTSWKNLRGVLYMFDASTAVCVSVVH
jgi:hypothetical protein